MLLLTFLIASLFVRFSSLAISIRHEKRLKREGAIEIGKRNSALLTVAHLGIYIVAPIEAWHHGVRPDAISLAGLVIYLWGMAWLAIVIRLLGRLWTVKLIIAVDHQLVVHPVFRAIRHPNYYLAIVPELIGYCAIFHAWGTLAIGSVLYAIPLSIRILQEERAMASRFPDYSGRQPKS